MLLSHMYAQLVRGAAGLFAISLKSQNGSSYQLNFKNDGTLRLNFGTETVSCHLLLQIARMTMD